IQNAEKREKWRRHVCILHFDFCIPRERRDQMSIVVIGGHSRSVGKTSVVAGLIAALPERRWTAMKITQYGHGVCSVNGEDCGCAVDEHTWAVTPEQDRSGN